MEKSDTIKGSGGGVRWVSLFNQYNDPFPLTYTRTLYVIMSWKSIDRLEVKYEYHFRICVENGSKTFFVFAI